MKPVKVGVLGLGTVGGGTVNVLKRNAAEIARRAGRDIIITRASAKDLSKKRICDTQGIILSTDPMDIINDPEIEIVLELIGGAGLVKEWVLKAIENGKHVVTANKSLIALHGNEIFKKASEQGVIVALKRLLRVVFPLLKPFVKA